MIKNGYISVLAEKAAARAAYSFSEDERRELVLRPLFVLELALKYAKEAIDNVVQLRKDSTKKAVRETKQAFAAYDKLRRSSMPKQLCESFDALIEQQGSNLLNEVTIYEFQLRGELASRINASMENYLFKDVIAKAYTATALLNFALTLDTEFSLEIRRRTGVRVVYQSDENLCLSKVRRNLMKIIEALDFTMALYTPQVKMAVSLLRNKLLSVELPKVKTEGE